MDIESIKESIIGEMPTRPVEKFEFVSRYGSGVGRALTQLIEVGDLVRIKRGTYSLSDRRLDERSYVEKEENKVFLPTKELKLLVRSFYSQFKVELLIKEGQSKTLEKVGYFKRSGELRKKADFGVLRIMFLRNIEEYRLTEEGYDIIKSM